MNIIIRSPNWIGDCIMSIPAIRALKYYKNDCRIILLVKKGLEHVFKGIDEIDSVFLLPEENGYNGLKSRIKRVSALISEGDEALLFTNSFNSAMDFFLVRKKVRPFGYRRDLRSFLLRKDSPPFPKIGAKHHRYFYLDLVEGFLKKKIDRDFSDKIYFTERESLHAENLLDKLDIKDPSKIIGISPSAAYGSAKEWPALYFIELIKKIKRKYKDYTVLLMGGNKEAQKTERIADLFTDNVISVSGHFSLRESMSLISLCSLFISNDSGLMHIASSLKIPLISIFGPTLPDSTAPDYPDHILFFKKAVCWPCKGRECSAGNHICMESITPDEVFEAVVRLLER